MQPATFFVVAQEEQVSGVFDLASPILGSLSNGEVGPYMNV